jgi:hypothetical protein
VIKTLKNIIAFIRSLKIECGCKACWKESNNKKKCLGGYSDCKCGGKCKNHKH